MTTEFKLIFDECLSQSMMTALQPFLERSGNRIRLQAVVDYYKAGTHDDVWIPEIAQEGGWVVLSSDYGRSRNEKPDKRLPLLCRRYGVTHVLLSPQVHGLKAFNKGQAIVQVWSELLKTCAATPGTRFVLQFNQTRTGFLIRNADIKQQAKSKHAPVRAKS